MSVCPLQKPFEYTVYWAAQANVNDSKVATHFDPKTRFQTKASVTTVSNVSSIICYHLLNSLHNALLITT